MDNQELNEKWNIHEVVDQAVRGAMQYNDSSKQSSIEIAVLKTNQNNLMDKIESNHKENNIAHEEIMKSMKEFHTATNDSLKELVNKLDSALEKKAEKWVEKVIIWLGITIGVGLIGYFGTLIIKVIELG